MTERDIANIDVRGVRRGALAIAGGIVFAGLAAWFLLRQLGPAENTPGLARPESGFSPAPRLQPAPQLERGAYFAEKARKLGSFGWADREAGMARIPLEDAMRLLAARKPAQEPAPEARASSARSAPALAPSPSGKEGR
jgi:hypothetical protein